MCAQCAMVALAAIGTYGVFRDQIRAKIDRSMAAVEYSDTTARPLQPSEGDDDFSPRQPEPVSLLVLVMALGRLRHQMPVAPKPPQPPPKLKPAEDW